MKKTKMYVWVGGTLLRVDRIPSVMSVMPTPDEISDHFNACRVNGKFIPIDVTVEKGKFDEICSEVKRASGRKELPRHFFPIVLDSSTKPIIFISEKNE